MHVENVVDPFPENIEGPGSRDEGTVPEYGGRRVGVKVVG